MPAATRVTPKRWTETEVLFDNRNYSLIQGTYEHDDGTKEEGVIGERWNGETTQLGFPNVAGFPVWHVVPEFLELPVLNGLLAELGANPYEQAPERGYSAGAEAAVMRRGRVVKAIRWRTEDEG